VTFRGRVVRKRVSAGSKHEHDALVLITADGAEYRLRREGGNPFRDPELDYLEGKNIECEGVERNAQVIMSRWEVAE
jgi:hypothetical protein